MNTAMTQFYFTTCVFSFVFIVRNIREFFFLLRQWPRHGQRSPRYVINDGCLIWSYICKRALDLRATEHGFPPKSEQTICDEQTTYKWLIRRWELFLHVLCLLIYHSKHIRFFKIDDIHIKRNESFFCNECWCVRNALYLNAPMKLVCCFGCL